MDWLHVVLAPLLAAHAIGGAIIFSRTCRLLGDLSSILAPMAGLMWELREDHSPGGACIIKKNGEGSANS